MIQNQTYAADFEELSRVCVSRNVAMQTIKSITAAPWGERQHTATTWYEPLKDQPDIDRAVSWVLGRPGIFLNTVGDIHFLPKVLDAANRFEKRPSTDEMTELVRVREMAPLFV
jgi:hypothetical protein